ncbi:MAG: hypothetical protein J5507_03160 [Clostridia bacterium]|nr:hypothetical protein [Clostridia bacterium]
MNKKQIRNYQIFSAIFVIILGTMLHFTYKWSGENKLIGLFSAINESTWEHLKLVFFPMLISIIIGYFYIGKNTFNFVCSKTLGLILGMGFIVIFFYTYSGILGNNIAILDIISFLISVILGEFLAYMLMVNKIKCNKKIAVIVLIIIAISFIIFTYYPPDLGIFRDALLNR